MYIYYRHFVAGRAEDCCSGRPQQEQEGAHNSESNTCLVINANLVNNRFHWGGGGNYKLSFDGKIFG
jgi:hypothetical protein